MKEIEFNYLSRHEFEAYPKPYPAKDLIPEWFRNIPHYHENKFKIENGATTATARRCLPLLDGITAGYIVPLRADVLVEQQEDGPKISWIASRGVFAKHDSSSSMIPPPPGFTNKVAKYYSGMRVKTPKGYSIMIQHPAGYHDSPLRAIPAVIDSDGILLDSSFPVWIREGFEGIIEKGTPIVQVIPFKRESWKSVNTYIEKEDLEIEADKHYNSILKNHYLKNFWHKKEYK